MTTTLVPIVCACVAALIVLAVTPLTARFAQAGRRRRPPGRPAHPHVADAAPGRPGHPGRLPRARRSTTCRPTPPARGLVAGATLIALLGAVDDIWGLTPAMKLVGQVACAAVPVSAGLTIDHVTLPFVGAQDLGPRSTC